MEKMNWTIHEQTQRAKTAQKARTACSPRCSGLLWKLGLCVLALAATFVWQLINGPVLRQESGS